MEYTPIDYDNWNFNGQGENIAKFLTPNETKIWGKALPLQDKRNDPGHAEFVTYFSLKILEFEPANRNVVIPAAILHDIGWSQMSPTELNLFADQNMSLYEPILRARHQEAGVYAAKEILSSMTYNLRDLSHVLEIISQHDTRNGSFSLEDGITRDADKLWRFTVQEIETCVNHRGKNAETLFQRNKDYIKKEGFLFTEIAKGIAACELENTKRYFQK